MTRIPVTLFTAAILGLLLLVLSVRVSVVRMRTRVLLGDGGGDPHAAALTPAIRAQANFAEYVPLLLILLGAIEVSGAGRVTCEVFSALLIIGRVAHALGLRNAEANPLRAGGILLTWAVTLGLCVEALLLLAHPPG